MKIYQDSRGLGACRSCGAPVEWAQLASGKRHPFNVPIATHAVLVPVIIDGRIVEDVNTAATVSHFATCPDAKAWRRA